MSSPSSRKLQRRVQNSNNNNNNSSNNNNNNNNNNSGSRGHGQRTGGGPAPFLVKTHQMVEDEGTNEVISWGESGTSFVVWKPVEFARDLLPLRFKHNNFSSFVRQLNTYGFRKVVPDRWEFASDNFRRGEPSLLCDIRRRRAPPNPSMAIKPSTAKNTTTSTSTSLDSSTSSPPPPAPPPPPPQSQQFLDLSNENEKLKKDNQFLNNELTQAKQQCQQLLNFLSKYVRTNDINASLLMKEAALVGVEIDPEAAKKIKGEEAAMEAKAESDNNNVACLKLFGVLLNATSGGRKRGWCEEGSGGGGRPAKVCFGGGGVPWMGMTSPVRESSKVCN